MSNTTVAQASTDLGEIPIVILNWNGLADTIECVDALLHQDYPAFHIHLIDNGSDNGEADTLDKRYHAEHRVTVTANATNLGFTGGVNEALQRLLAAPTPPEAIALLNNDTVADTDWLSQLARACVREQAALVGSRMLNYYEPDQLDNAGHIWLDSGEILPRGPGEPAADYSQADWLVGVCAGAMLVRSSLIREIGAFDPFFETGYEDAEFGLRAYLAGHPAYYEPAALVRHKISRSIDKVRSRQYAMRIQLNINYTYGKLTPGAVMALNAVPIALKTFGVLLIGLLTGRWVLLSAHGQALRATWRHLPDILRARRSAKADRRVSIRQVLRGQRFFLPFHFSYFRRYILTGRKTVFER